MLQILKGSQIKQLDRAYLTLSGIQSLELMERAAQSFCDWFLLQNFDSKSSIAVFCGAGNNGGDGFAIGRILFGQGYTIKAVLCFDTKAELSPDCFINKNSLPKEIEVLHWKDFSESPEILIDAFLGVGLSGKLRADAIEIVNKINSSGAKIFSVDLPSGLPSDEVCPGKAVCAHTTVTLATPKLSLLLKENGGFVGELVLVDIGISTNAFVDFHSNHFYIQGSDIPSRHIYFGKYAHKGDLGKIFLLGGNPGKMGALVLCAKSAFRTGAGLVTCHLEESERFILQTAVPEAMVKWGVLGNLDIFDAIGVGPGWGMDSRKELLTQVFEEFEGGLVLDADAINLLSKYPELLLKIPKYSILTPHVGEFDLLLGPSVSHLARLEKAAILAKKYQIIMILKGAHTVISLPDGRQLFNSSGTQYMASAGSGDVLTGMITAYLGMGYSPENAAICGVYHHGLAGEIAAKNKRRGLMALDIVEAIPETYLALGIH